MPSRSPFDDVTAAGVVDRHEGFWTTGFLFRQKIEMVMVYLMLFTNSESRFHTFRFVPPDDTCFSNIVELFGPAFTGTCVVD